MKEIALHLIDLAENSINAEAGAVHISVVEDFRADRLTISVEDDSRAPKLDAGPLPNRRPEDKVGLGIPFLKESAEACGGGMEITNRPDEGTKVVASFQHSHTGRQVLGNLTSTILTLTVTHPEIHWTFTYAYNPPFRNALKVFEFDDRPLKESLTGIPLNHPEVLAYLRAALQDGIDQARGAIHSRRKPGEIECQPSNRSKN
jgi:hypothetical protein